ncbi:dihydrodipicolinate synthase family protein [Glaciecola sp. 2405UD65-10]|uniref:dihydrodipicolinate synthase family protein n=1 Tax=Glaciecola sp. 2405UD65-10 TaxID=3397244 RepID=UPI003B58D764
MFSGLSAFPLTPFKDEKIDYSAFESLLSNLVDAKVDSICPLGSTGLYPYLSVKEKESLTTMAVQMALNIPVMVGIGALRTSDVLRNLEVVQKAGVDAVLLAPTSYHPLKEAEVFALYEKVSANLSIPLCIYDNPGTTQFSFSDDLYVQLAQLNKIEAIKMPGKRFECTDARDATTALRASLPANFALGVSGDKFGVRGMQAGCDMWLSVLGGLFPNTVKQLIYLAKQQNTNEANNASEKLSPIWDLFVQHKGGMRVMAGAAHLLGYTEAQCLPQPLQALDKDEMLALKIVLQELNMV